MGVVLESNYLELAFASFLILWYALYSYVTENYDYWKKRHVASVRGVFPFGSLPSVSIGQQQISLGYDECYRKFKGHRYFGVIEGCSPVLVVNDLDLIKYILSKNFTSFGDRFHLPESQKTEYMQHLFNMSAKDWRTMRLLLAPTFTSSKMKNMFFLTKKCCSQLEIFMETAVKKGVVDTKDVLARFSMDIITTCAFGLDINSISDKNCEFFTMASNIAKVNTLEIIIRLCYELFPLLTKIYPPKLIGSNIPRLFTKVIRDTVSYREKNRVFRNDFLDIFIKIRQNKSINENQENSVDERVSPVDEHKSKSKQDGITIEEITAQSFGFFFAGLETASSTTDFALYELASNPNIQDKLYEEIKNILENNEGNVTYEALHEMKYMDQVIKETLRLYPSLGILNRVCTETYKDPESSLTIEKGTRVVIPVFAIHHDPEYYPQPDRFDPDRFTAERVAERHPCLHLPFGEGPRMCIGMRFGMMQTKIGLTTMLSNYKFDISPETEIPIKFDSKSLLVVPEKPIVLSVTKRKIYSS